MKYQVGDLLLVKEYEYIHRPRLRLSAHPPLPLRPRLHNTLGIITAVQKHSDIFASGSTEKDNGYIWYSQVDAKQYHFYENEVIGEVFK